MNLRLELKVSLLNTYKVTILLILVWNVKLIEIVKMALVADQKKVVELSVV